MYTALVACGCAEQAVCAERRVGGRDTVLVECSAGKVPVCGDRPENLYNQASGALLPTPELPDITDMATRASFTGSCEGVTGDCRPRPVCRGAAGETPTCATGETPFCVLGRVVEVAAARDAGPPTPEDAGGGGDAGADAGGQDDAGTDAGAEDDAGTDAGT